MAGKKAAADIRIGSSGDQFAVFAAVPRIGASSKQYLLTHLEPPQSNKPLPINS